MQIFNQILQGWQIGGGVIPGRDQVKFTIFFAKCIGYICDEAAIFLCDLEEFYPPKTAGKVDRRWFTDFTE